LPGGGQKKSKKKKKRKGLKDYKNRAYWLREGSEETTQHKRGEEQNIRRKTYYVDGKRRGGKKNWVKERKDKMLKKELLRGEGI